MRPPMQYKPPGPRGTGEPTTPGAAAGCRKYRSWGMDCPTGVEDSPGQRVIAADRSAGVGRSSRRCERPAYGTLGQTPATPSGGAGPAAGAGPPQEGMI